MDLAFSKNVNLSLSSKRFTLNKVQEQLLGRKRGKHILDHMMQKYCQR